MCRPRAENIVLCVNNDHMYLCIISYHLLHLLEMTTDVYTVTLYYYHYYLLLLLLLLLLLYVVLRL